MVLLATIVSSKLFCSYCNSDLGLRYSSWVMGCSSRKGVCAYICITNFPYGCRWSFAGESIKKRRWWHFDNECRNHVLFNSGNWYSLSTKYNFSSRRCSSKSRKRVFRARNQLRHWSHIGISWLQYQPSMMSKFISLLFNVGSSLSVLTCAVDVGITHGLPSNVLRVAVINDIFLKKVNTPPAFGRRIGKEPSCSHLLSRLIECQILAGCCSASYQIGCGDRLTIVISLHTSWLKTQPWCYKSFNTSLVTLVHWVIRKKKYAWGEEVCPFCLYGIARNSSPRGMK